MTLYNLIENIFKLLEQSKNIEIQRDFDLPNRRIFKIIHPKFKKLSVEVSHVLIKDNDPYKTFNQIRLNYNKGLIIKKLINIILKLI